MGADLAVADLAVAASVAHLAVAASVAVAARFAKHPGFRAMRSKWRSVATRPVRASAQVLAVAGLAAARSHEPGLTPTSRGASGHLGPAGVVNCNPHCAGIGCHLTCSYLLKV